MQGHIPGSIEDMISTTKDLKDAGVVIPAACPFSLPIQPVQKMDDSWRMVRVVS